ncbi:MAG: hypothetical protein KJZ52_10550, partial [Anaerolineales bacterium]|nr:hypothetical protein [Anaerolineales bacterium]
MSPDFLVFGTLTREFLLPAEGEPRLDALGGSLLYAAAGLRVWESNIGLVGRVGDDYPRAWLNECNARGFDTRGVKILPRQLDVREFVSYNEQFDVSETNPIAQFARRGAAFPKSLLGYLPMAEREAEEERRIALTDIPEEYLSARAALICPMDFSVQSQLVAGLKH